MHTEYIKHIYNEKNSQVTTIQEVEYCQHLEVLCVPLLYHESFPCFFLVSLPTHVSLYGIILLLLKITMQITFCFLRYCEIHPNCV